MKTVAIVGVGLIGGSFALALRKAGFGGEVMGVSSQPALEAGMRSGAISRSVSLEEAAASADVIYLAQTVDRILTTLETLGPIANSSCLITDAGSTKVAIVQKATASIRSATFIGGHPLAGKEQRGAAAADADLFRGRPYLLTPTAQETPRLEGFRLWLSRIGANVIELSAQEHDAIVALTSHLPQIVSVALAHVLATQKNERVTEIVGPGLQDMTRLAMSSTEMWDSIFATNKTEVLSALEAFVASLAQVRRAVEREDITGVFGSAATFATAIRNQPHKT
jgi:prephenate dehydrogenase